MKTDNKTENTKTTLNISISAEDKKVLKVAAAERGVTVAYLIHEFAEELKQENEHD